ncbi:hypothetical protein KEM55_008282 [Ascosphaera atra]|nr:hypothetical protein KEM55_008282 [Ascosphaera atra]
MSRTESARSALSSFHCSLCNKSYSRHPEYEAHIGSYDHQHRKRLRDLKQLTRDPNAAERARQAERKADAEAGLVVVENKATAAPVSSGTGGFKKGGFKSSFAAVGSKPKTVKNVLGDDDGDGSKGDTISGTNDKQGLPRARLPTSADGGDVETDTDDEIDETMKLEGGYYDPFRPTDCFKSCHGIVS